MLPVTLTHDELLRLLKYCGGVLLLVAGLILLFRLPELQAHPVKVIWQSASTALGVPALLVWMLAKVEWKHPRIAKLMGKRMVHGLWWGELKSEFKASENADLLPPIPVAFVVKQSYFFLTIQSYTPSLPAESTMERVLVQSKNSIAQLQYVFEMRRLQDAEDKITTGYGDLRLSSGDTRLEGYYWTNSPTRGHLSLQLVTRDFKDIDSFADAKKVRDELLKATVSAAA